MIRIVKLVIITIFPVAVFGLVFTTRSLVGVVSGTGGVPPVGTDVIVRHVPSGTTSGTSTRIDGSFDVLYKIGGPYSLKVSHIGYSPEERSGINLSRGENLKVTIVLLL